MSASAPAPDGVPLPQRYWAILTIGLGLTLAVLNTAIANVALPAIAKDLDITPATSIWVVNAFQLAVTVSLLPLASLGEIYGYRRVYKAGLILFTVASLFCAISTSLPVLIVARVAQGIGAAGLMSVNGALVRFIYPRAWLGRGVGLNATIGSVASAIGPSVASAILSVAHWPWLFAVSVPLGLLTIAVALKNLPQTPRSRGRFDFQSAILQAAALGLLLTGISELGHGKATTLVVVLMVAGLGIGAWLVAHQLSRTAPLLPVDLMRHPLFALAVASSICSFISQGMAVVALPFLYQHTLGLDQVTTGLLMTPWPLSVAVVAPFVGRLADRYPAGLLGGFGMLLMAAGTLAMCLLPEHPTMTDIVWRMTLSGIGFGFFNTPNNRSIIGSAPPNRAGGASGMQATARLFGQTTGAAIVALIFGWMPETGPIAALTVSAAAAGVAAAVSFSRLKAN